ncbi:MAG: SagB/ThcOx family dehydrogenase [Dethiobacteria bacterium]
MNYGDDFQRLSRYDREKLQGRNLDWENKPPLYKSYPPGLERIELGKPQFKDNRNLFDIIQQRRSIRRFMTEELEPQIFSGIIWATQGITLATEHHQFRASPSAGALYPIETYCVINRVKGLKPGVYHYQVPYHSLVLIKEGDYGKELARAALGQRMIDEAAFNLVWSAMIERSKWKYDQRAYRYIYLDAGHIAQNTALAAVSYNLGSCQIGAFFDGEVDRVIGVDGESEFSLYITAIGKPR